VLVLVGTVATLWKYVCRISGGRLREYYSAVLDLTHEPSGTTSQHMPYISKLERERQQEQKERERWMHFMDAVKYVGKKDGCTDERAAEQLVTAIVDQALAAQWGGDLGLQPIIPSEFTGILKICLYGVGFVKRNRETAKAKSITRWTGKCPKIQFVNGPVFNDFQDVPLTENLPYAEVSTLTYIPLLVLTEDMDRWPLEDSSTKVRSANKARIPRSKNSTKEKIRTELKKIFKNEKAASRKPPNEEEAWEKLVALGVGPRDRVREVLKEKEFSSQRLKPGERWQG